MKQKILIKVELNGEQRQTDYTWDLTKCFRQDEDLHVKVLTTAVSFLGIQSAGWKGKDKDHIEVIADGVDAADLTMALRSKNTDAKLVEVNLIKENKEDEKKEETKDDKKNNNPEYPFPYTWGHVTPIFPLTETNYNPACCTIM
ncbi:hypothetical protein Droror1_Dr00002949 [Drosera rotundifolia]